MVVFPQPDSPTSPKVSPLLIKKETSSTAFTTFFSKSFPLATGKCCFKCSISSSFLFSITCHLPVPLKTPPSAAASRRCSGCRTDLYTPASALSRFSYRTHTGAQTDIRQAGSAYRPVSLRSEQVSSSPSRPDGECCAEVPWCIRGTDDRKYRLWFRTQ